MMTGERGNDSGCPLCGGRLSPGTASVPFLFPEAVVVVKGVPAEICASCHEPYMGSRVAERVTGIVRQVRACGAEVSVVAFPDPDVDLATEAPSRAAA